MANLKQQIENFIGDKKWLSEPDRPDMNDMRQAINLLEQLQEEKPITEHPDVQRLIQQIAQVQALQRHYEAIGFNDTAKRIGQALEI